MSAAISSLAWTLALASVWGYGRSLRLGAAIGMVCATSFIIAASSTGDVVAWAANAAFLALHVLNYRKAGR